jgi:hypothetical protein
MSENPIPNDGVEALSVLGTVAHEVIWLDTKWEAYNALFSRDASDVAILNRRTGLIFRLLQGSLIDDIILTLAKVLDRAQSSVRGETRPNATFALLLSVLPAHVPNETRDQLNGTLRELTRLCATLVHHRNRRVAHADLRTALRIDLLDTLPVATMNEAVATAKFLVNDISNAIDGRAIGFHFPEARYHADQLIRIMRLGNEAVDRENAARGIVD